MKNVFGVEGVIGVPAYLAMMILAIITGVIIILCLYKKFNFKKTQVLWLAGYVIVFGLLGAHLFSLLFRLGEVNLNSWKEFYTSVIVLFSALMYYGGFIGGMFGAWLFSKKEDVPFLLTADLVICALPLAHALGRVGCFLAGCCYGMHTDSCIGVEFPYGYSTGKVLPTQLFEVAFNIILFIAIIIVYFVVYRKGLTNKNDKVSDSKYVGLISIIYLIAYPIYRFIVEFFRDDNRGEILILSTSQFISIFVLAFGIYNLYKYIKESIKNNNFVFLDIEDYAFDLLLDSLNETEKYMVGK
ncbi:MAG: prolipoprotein diacylglyceryl transferase, partial [Clostridia bacterium]